MKTVQISEATGPALDWLVAVCQGFDAALDEDKWLMRGGIATASLASFSPSTDWSQGGPIIEREKIETRLFVDDGSVWYAHLGAKPFPADAQATGATPLIAAMRCFVTAKLGETVEVPEELT